MNLLGKLFQKPRPALYRLIDPASQDVLGPWAAQFPRYTHVIGYSSLGHVFLLDPAALDYAVLHPFKGAAKSYGRHASIAAFEKAVLREPGFEAHVLRPEHVQAIANRLGLLSGDEIYIPQPYPFLGGSEAPETYAKGGIWVFLHVVADMCLAPAAPSAPATSNDGSSSAPVLFASESVLRNCGGTLGYADGSLFVMLAEDAFRILEECDHDRARVCARLDVPVRAWQDQRIFLVQVPSEELRNLRISSGNEAGVDARWVPGGFHANGFRQAVIDPVALDRCGTLEIRWKS